MDDFFFILPVYLVALGTKLLLALSIFKSIGRHFYLQVKFSPKSQYNLLDVLFMSEPMLIFELNLAF